MDINSVGKLVGAGSGAGGGIDPMRQFELKRLIEIYFGNLDISFTNSSLWMVIAIFSASFLLLSGSSRMVPGRMQSVGEIIYEFVANMVRDILGDAGRTFFPFVFTLFMFILACNMMGMLPYSFTVTSHIIVTFTLALVVFLGATVIGFIKHGTGYLRLFVPHGIPAVLLPLLVVIEVISYLTRPISLAVRLFANMLAGHMVLKVFAGFVTMMGVFGFVPLALMVAITGFEFLVAFLQAYVFAILTCIYLNDAINMH